MILSPIKGPFRITQKYADRPEFYAKYGFLGHEGLDLSGPIPGKSLTLHAPIEGKITVAGEWGNYGQCVVIESAPDLKGRSKQIVLGHLASISVKERDWIYLADPVGQMGRSGEADGVHVHLGLRIRHGGVFENAGNGFKGFIDPAPYLLSWS